MERESQGKRSRSRVQAEQDKPKLRVVSTSPVRDGSYDLYRDVKRAIAGFSDRAFDRMIGRSEGDGILPGGVAHPEVKQAIESRGGKGQKLRPDDRKRFGGALGDSLSDVTVHTDNKADELCRSVAANAFAVRTSSSTRDVFFGKGNYNPGTKAGDRLLGEELAHLAQQKNAAMTSELKISDHDSSLEKEARDFGEQISKE